MKDDIVEKLAAINTEHVIDILNVLHEEPIAEVERLKKENEELQAKLDSAIDNRYEALVQLGSKLPRELVFSDEFALGEMTEILQASKNAIQNSPLTGQRIVDIINAACAVLQK